MNIFDWESRKDPETNAYLPAPYQSPRSLLASAQRIDISNPIHAEKFASSRKRTSWQKDAWDFYDLIGEIKFSANLVANVLSRINLYVAYITDTARVPSHIRQVDEASEYADLAENILALLETDDGGASNVLRLAALNMFVAGEFYLVKIPGETFLDGPSFEIRSTDEVHIEGTGDKIQIFLKGSPNEDKKFWKALPQNSFICRMWRKHPRYTQDADSSVRGVLDDCDDLVVYSREARSISLSRIPAGLLFVPDSLQKSATPDSDEDDLSDGTDVQEYDLAQDITNAFIEPITDETNPHNSAPLVITGPAEAGKDIRYISTERTYDQMYQKNLEFKIERILSALDIPKDISKGLADVKYCASEDTEIFTRTGWKSYDQLTLEDEVYTLNHETGMGEWQTPTAINVFAVENEPMLSLDTRNHSSLTTSEHMWPTISKETGERTWTTSYDLTEDDLIIIDDNSTEEIHAETSSLMLYTGNVWCPTTPNRTWFARRNGKSFFTGNSNGTLIEESLYKSHIEPMTLLIVDALTTGFLRPALIGNGVPEDVAKRITIWYDPSSITAKPSKSEAANFGIENRLVSPSAWRAAHGFSETDAPDENWIAEELLVSKLALDPQLAQNLLKMVFPSLVEASREESFEQMDPESVDALGEALQPGNPGNPELLEP